MQVECLTLEEDVSTRLIVECGRHGLSDQARLNLEALCSGDRAFELALKGRLLAIATRIGVDDKANYLLARAVFVLSRTRNEAQQLLQSLPESRHIKAIDLIAHNNLQKSNYLQWPSSEHHTTQKPTPLLETPLPQQDIPYKFLDLTHTLPLQ